MTQVLAAQRLMVMAKGSWWKNLSPGQKESYQKDHPNSEHSETYDPKDDWWKHMTPDMKSQYVKDHPKSKYAKEWKGKGDGKAVKKKKDGQDDQEKNPNSGGPGHSEETHSEKPEVHEEQKREQHNPYVPKGSAATALTHLPKEASQFFSKGGSAPGSDMRQEAASQFRSKSGTLAKSILHDVNGAHNKLRALHQHSLTDEPDDAQVNEVNRLLHELLNNSAFKDILAELGIIGMLLFLAVLEADPYRLYAIVHHALAKMDMSDGEDELHAAMGDGESKRDDLPAVHAALRLMDRVAVTASEQTDEQAIRELLASLAEYAANGDIPDEAWEVALIALAKLIHAQEPQQKPI